MVKNLKLKTHNQRLETLHKNLASVPRLITNEARAKRLVWNDSQYLVKTNISHDSYKVPAFLEGQNHEYKNTPTVHTTKENMI